MNHVFLDIEDDFQSARGARVDRLLLRRKISSPADIRPLLQFGRPNRSSFSGHDDGLGAEEKSTRRLGCAHNVDDDARTSDRIAWLSSGTLKNFRFRSAATIQRSHTCTPLSALALSRGLYGRAGTTPIP